MQHIVHKLICSQCFHVQAQPGQPLRIIAERFDQLLASGWVKMFDSSLKELPDEVDLSPGMLATPPDDLFHLAGYPQHQPGLPRAGLSVHLVLRKCQAS